MKTVISRRGLLSGAAALALGTTFPALRGMAAPAPAVVRAESRTIEVAGRAARVYGLAGPGDRPGLTLTAADRFRVQLRNGLGEPTLIHWHGLTPPYRQDGVPVLAQAPLGAGETYDYDFPLTRPGTNWMHSHLGLQEQRLLAAPLIVRDPAEAGLDEQEVVVMLHDFTFRDPEEVLAGLSGGGMAEHGGMPAMAGHAMPAMPGHGPMSAGPDLNDIEFDAFLANDRGLDDPEVVAVERGGRVRLRIINGAAATNFMLDLGAMKGEIVAVDGMPVLPIAGSRFPLAIAQRLDIRLIMPVDGSALPVLALREGSDQRTGIVLAPRGAAVSKLTASANNAAPALDLSFEAALEAATPLPQRAVGRRVTVGLTGDMMGYLWGIDGLAYGQHRPISVSRGERVELTLANRTGMAHPMHLHGHHFQVVAIGAKRLSGAMRDTVLVPPMTSVTLAFDADNPGVWAFHCHHMYHMAAGMMTTMAYTDNS